MNRLRILAFLFLLTAICLSALPAAGQRVKAISVRDGEPYTDHISLGEDSRDTDVMVKFFFDEKQNTLRVSVLSYRRLFVFQEAARYKQVVRHRRLLPEKLPYVAQHDKKARFTLSKRLRKSIRPHRRYVFRRWMEYEGLQPTPADYKMVNDYIEQRFDIHGKQTSAAVTLRDIFLLDAEPKDPDHFVLTQGSDLDLKYQITLVRNPCLGLDDQIMSARNQTAVIKKAYKALRATIPTGTVSTEDAYKNFQEMQKNLVALYPAKDANDPCPDLAKAYAEYNAYVDSIGKLSCKLLLPEEAAWNDGMPLDIKLLHTQTRQLDKAVARWLVSKDALEKKDLVTECEDIIKDMTAMLRQHRAVTPEEQKAVEAYRQAEQYFHKTCKK